MIGQRLGHFRILDKIGAGGMGEVYRARDEQLDRDVALKILAGCQLPGRHGSRSPAARGAHGVEAEPSPHLHHPRGAA